MSLDGFIAGPAGESDWIVMDPEIDFKALTGSFDTIVMGRGTYEAVRKMGAGGGMPGMAAYVFSRTLSAKDCKGATVSSDPEKTLDGLREKRARTFGSSAAAVCFVACSISASSTPSKSR
jgi:dihydrofolate reductase